MLLSYLANINTPKLFENETLQCEGKLTLKEYWDALILMVLLVSLQRFTRSLLVSTLHFCNDECKLASSQKQTVVTLFGKTRKIRDLLRIGDLFLF